MVHQRGGEDKPIRDLRASLLNHAAYCDIMKNAAKNRLAARYL